jgi:hypothetical protein
MPVLRACLIFGVLLAGCHDVREQKERAIASSRHLQELWNNNACEQIYETASAAFRRLEMRERWRKDCAGLRQRLGQWEDFSPRENNAWPIGTPGIVWVRGPARFASGAAVVRLDWELGRETTALYNLLIELDGEQISIPGFSGEIRRP